MHYVIYSPSSGSITSSGTCNSIDDLTHMIIPDERAALVGVSEGVSHTSHRIISGELVPYTDSQIAHKATIQIPGMEWSDLFCTWVDMRSLATIKDAKWGDIKAAREEYIDAPLVTPYGTFDCKVKDRTNITDAVLLLQTLAAVGTPTNIDFTLSDNSTVSLTTTEMVTVGLLLGQKVQAAHTQARTLRAQIDAANSSTELEAIVWV